MGLPALSGLTPEAIAKQVDLKDQFRARQIFSWIARGARSFDDMTDVPLSVRDHLSTRFSVRAASFSNKILDNDGTAKLTLSLYDNSIIEAVLLTDDKGRKTACVSTQVGCAMSCVFCKTGQLGFLRNLSSSEIFDQFLFLRDEFGDIDNLVFMGMGEPLLNLEALRTAISVLGHAKGLNFSHRRITVSTCGIVAGIQALCTEGPAVRLAVSLNSADQDLRAELMPIAKKNTLPALKAALVDYQNRYGKRITLEVVLLGGVNCSITDADKLAAFATGLDVVFNLIPWNPVEGAQYKGKNLIEPDKREISSFAARLRRLGQTVTERHRRGRGVSGACGQLGVVPLKP